jgi:hypothetical protein
MLGLDAQKGGVGGSASLGLQCHIIGASSNAPRNNPAWLSIAMATHSCMQSACRRSHTSLKPAGYKILHVACRTEHSVLILVAAMHKIHVAVDARRR